MSEQEYYNRLYTLHQTSNRQCRESIFDIDKACRRVGQVIDYFNLSLPEKASTLDVGCGLGFYTEALNRQGFSVTGIDISRVAVANAQRRFPGPLFEIAQFPEEIDRTYDLIWSVDVSLLNTFDRAAIDHFISESIRRVNPGGALVIGWHTDFGGRMIENENWAGWDLHTMRDFRNAWGLEGPAIVQTRHPLLNLIAMRLCRILRKSAPVFLMKKL